MKHGIFVVSPLVAALAACGGGSGDGNQAAGPLAPTSSGAVSVYVTDNLTQDYTEVWVSLKEIKTHGSNGTEYRLFENVVGQPLNLASLAGVGRLVNTQNLPAGVYSEFHVELGNSVVLVDNSGKSTTARLTNSGSDVELNVAGKLDVAAGAATAFAIDFDLAKFTYDPATQLVTPVVVYQDAQRVDDFTRSYAKLEGRVQSIASATQFVIVPEYGTAPVTVSLDGATVVLDERVGKVPTSAISTAREIEVYGSYDRATMTLSAATITLDSSDDVPGDSDSSGLTEVEGRVVQTNGSTLVLDVHDADVLIEGNTISVAGISNAVFYRGALNQLAVGQPLELKGSWDGSTFTAQFASIESSLSTDSDDGAGGDDAGTEASDVEDYDSDDLSGSSLDSDLDTAQESQDLDDLARR